MFRGMRNYFLQVKSFIEHNFQEIPWHIDGANYPPSEQSQLIAQLCSYLWIFGIIMLMGGSRIFNTFGIPEPSFISFMNKNNVICFVVLFMINSYGTNLLATGAFEVYIDDNLVFSKLQNGRLPNGEDIISIVEQYLRSS